MFRLCFICCCAHCCCCCCCAAYCAARLACYAVCFHKINYIKILSHQRAVEIYFCTLSACRKLYLFRSRRCCCFRPATRQQQQQQQQLQQKLQQQHFTATTSADVLVALLHSAHSSSFCYCLSCCLPELLPQLLLQLLSMLLLLLLLLFLPFFFSSQLTESCKVSFKAISLFVQFHFISLRLLIGILMRFIKFSTFYTSQCGVYQPVGYSQLIYRYL